MGEDKCKCKIKKKILCGRDDHKAITQLSDVKLAKVIYQLHQIVSI
jgi:hypothetical protein